MRDQGTLALGHYFARLAETTPVVILLEDLHWADSASMRLLDGAARLWHDYPVMVVATTRPSLLEDRPRWGDGLTQHVRLTLGALSGRESRTLVQALLHRVDALPTEVVDLVVDAGEGNPFYLEELVSWLVDSGVVVPDQPSWRVVPALLGGGRAPFAQGAAPGPPRRPDRPGTGGAATGVGRGAGVLGRGGDPPRTRPRRPPRGVRPPARARRRLRTGDLHLRLGPGVPVQARAAARRGPRERPAHPATGVRPPGRSVAGGDERAGPAATRSMPRSSPSTSTAPATRPPQSGTCGQAAAPPGCSPWTTREPF